MKAPRSLALLALALPIALVPLSLPRVHATPVAVLNGGADPAFREKFKKLLEKPVKAELEKLVKSESTAAAAWIVKSNEILAVRPDDPELATFRTELAAAWKGAQKTAFPEKYQEYLEKLAGDNKKERPGLRERFDKAIAEFEGNADKKDNYVYAQLADELETLGYAFEQIGDQYFASESWIALSGCYDATLRSQGADPKRALAGLDRALAARAKFELNDARKDELEKRRTALGTKAAPDGPVGGAGQGGEGPTDAGAAVEVPLTFEMVSSIDAFQRPNYELDELYVVWRGINLKRNGSSSGLEGLHDGPVFHRLGSADVRIDVDGDGKADGPSDQKLALTGSVMALKTTLGKGAAARPWGCLAVTAGQQETYQGVQVNMAPNDDRLDLLVCGAASVVGTLDGQPIRIVDETIDGLYGTQVESFGFAGTTKGSYQPYFDSLIVGAAKRARPFSEIAEVNGKWWKLEIGSNGKSIKASPIKTDTGTLKLEYKGPIQPVYLIVRGDGPLKLSFYDLVEGGAKGVQVPIGRYTLAYGEIRKGKKKQMQKCVILPPRNAGTYDVAKGGTTVITLGAPYGFDFEVKNEDGKLTVRGNSVAVKGAAGERYERTWQCVPHAEAGWRKKGAKKADKYTRFPLGMGIETIEKLGWESLWFPLDLELDAKGQGEVEVQLVDKKHELFGKIESDWK